jgi:hypothetical protein
MGISSRIVGEGEFTMKSTKMILIALTVLAGCKSGSVPSTVAEKSIVQKVEDAGIRPNDLTHADAAGLQLWFGQHMDVARNVAAQCKAAAKDDPTWKTSEEGRICLGDKYVNYGETSSN